jgi:hypothetical protein
MSERDFQTLIGAGKTARRRAMHGTRRLAVIWLAPAVALALSSGASPTADAPRQCCFTNERFAGVCEVVPEPNVTCADILAYLNNPNATGKTYCGTTDIRGGWMPVECSEGTPTPSRRSSSGCAAVAVAERGGPRRVQGSK